MKGSSCAEKLLASLATHPDLDPDALRALIKATRLLGLACGSQLAQYRNSAEPLQARLCRRAKARSVSAVLPSRLPISAGRSTP